MTIATQSALAGPFTGNGSTTVFSFSFKCFSQADLQVIREESDVQTVLTITTNYTVTLNADQEASPGGNVTMVTAPTATQTVFIVSDVDYTQEAAFTNAGGFYPTVLNDARDRTTLQIQQLNDKIARAALLPVGDTPTAGLLDAIEAVNPVIGDISTVAGISLSVQAVADIDAETVVVAGISTKVVTVAADTVAINGVWADLNGSDTIGVVAADLSGSNTIGQAVSSASAAADSAAEAAASAATVASKTGMVDTIVELSALTGGVNEAIQVKAHTTLGDGGGGLFIWDSSDATSDDNGFYIQPDAGGVGRWIRKAPEGVASPLWFGAAVDGVTDDSTKLQAAIDFLETHYSGGVVELPEGVMLVDDINLVSQLTLKGLGADVSILKLPASSSPSSPMFALSSSGSSSLRYGANVVFEDFTIDGNASNQTVERWLQNWNDNTAITDPENDYTANGGGIGDSGLANIVDDDYIATAQSGTAATALTLTNTTMPVAKVLTATTFAAARRVRIVSAGNDSGITFTVVGTDFEGSALSEVITGANASTAEGSEWFKTVTSVTPSGNTASTVEVGIEEYDSGSAASAGRRNPNYTTVKTLANFDKARAVTINRLYVKNHKGKGFNDRGCLGFTVENCVFEDVGKNDGPFFPIWSQSFGTTTGDQAFFAESDGLCVRNNVATKLERGFVIFNSLAGGLIENNIIDGYGEAAIFAGSLNLASTDADGIVTSTTPVGAGSIALDGVRVSSGVAYFTNARTVTVTSVSNEMARTFTITGTDARGVVITDAFTGANAGEARSNRRFLTVTSVSVDAATAGAVEVGCDRIYANAIVRGNTFRNGILTDIASYGIELNANARDITIEDNFFEEIDEGAIAAAGVKNVTINRNTFRNCYAASVGNVPYGPFAERFGFNIGAAPIAGDAITRSGGYYITIGTQAGIGGENVLITNNFAEDERSPDAPFILAVKSGGNSLSGYHVVTGNILVSSTAWDVCDYTTNTLVFSDDGQLNIWNNQGDLATNGDGYAAVFSDLAVDTDGLIYNSSNGHVGVGTSSPTRKFEVLSSNNVPARFTSTASTCKLRLVASGTSLGANEPEISVVGNALSFRTNNIDHLQCDGTGNVNVPSGVYEVGGTQVLGTQGAAISSLTDSTGGTTDGTLSAISGTSADANLNGNFAELNVKIDSVLSALRTHGLIAT